jgi:hypothetical protein
MRQIVALTAVNENPVYRSFIEFFTTSWTFEKIEPVILDLPNLKDIRVDEALVPSANQAQIIRLLYPALFPDKVFLLCDIDMAAVNLRYFKNLTSLPIASNEIVNFSSDAYPSSDRMPICYYFGYGEAFRRITGVYDLVSLKQAMCEWWQKGHGWATDEIVFGQLLADSVQKKIVRFRGIRRGWENGVAFRRLDRSQAGVINSVFDPIDAHLERPFSSAGEMVAKVKSLRNTFLATRSVRYVSYSLWGEGEIYNVGAIANAESTLHLLPDWKAVFFHPPDHPHLILEELRKLGARTVEVRGGESMRMFWRFLAHDLPDTFSVIFRDTDSRITLRERSMIFEWISSGRDYHIIRDHPAHSKPILGGMWGMLASDNLIMRAEIEAFRMSGYSTKDYDDDQKFLEKVIYPRAKHNSLVHDEFFDNSKNVPFRKGLEFVGQRVNPDGSVENRHLDEMFAWERLKRIPAIQKSLLSRVPMFMESPKGE